MRTRFAFVLIALLIPAGLRAANTYYISTTGSDSNNGLATGAAFATFPKAISSAGAGDTIFVLGGTYNISSTVNISSSKTGTAANPIKLFAMPGQAPVLNFAAVPSGARGIQLDGSYWQLKGLAIQNAKDNGINVTGSNNVLDQLSVHNNQDSGVQLSGSGGRTPANNLVVNTDSYSNYDPVAHGENADGFAAKFRELGPGNVFRGDRAWGNSDDGWDFWAAANGVTVENSWSYKNGFNTFGDSAFAGDGNGVKLGHDSGPHTLKNVVVWGNRLNGIDVNGNATVDTSVASPYTSIAHGTTIENVTAYSNGTSTGSKNFNFDEFVSAYPHTLRNNVSLTGTNTIQSGNISDHNTWNGAAFSTDAADFISLDDTIATGARLADGSLPISTFLRLNAGSNLIDAGVNVGLPYGGSAPDLGAFEVPEPGSFLMFLCTTAGYLSRRVKK